MYNDLNEHKRSDNIKWICTLIAFILLFACIVALIVPVYINIGKAADVETGSASEAEEKTDPAAFVMTPQQEYGIRLMSLSSTPEALATDDAYNRTIKATVLPEDAPNKEVVWSLSWASGATLSSNDVNQYVKVTPNADNSNIATVTCLKAFTNSNITLTVKTVVGEYTATCNIRYIGIPTSVEADTSNLTVVNDSNFNVDVIEYAVGESIFVPLKLSNEMNVVGADFGDYNISIKVMGGLTATRTVYNSANEVTSTSTEDVVILTQNLWDSDGYIYLNAQAGTSSTSFIKITKGTNGVHIMSSSYFSDYGGTAAGPGGHADIEFLGYQDNKIPCFEITVSEADYGASTTFYVRPTQIVKSVSVDTNVIEY